MSHFSHSAETRKVRPLVCMRDYPSLKQEADALLYEIIALFERV